MPEAPRPGTRGEGRRTGPAAPLTEVPMSAQFSRRLAALKRVLASWYTPVTLGVLLLAAFAAWVMPRRNAETAEWDTARWQAVAVWWRPALGLTLLLAVLLLVVWYSHGWLL